MTRTGKSVRLSQHLAEPFAEIHPGDAQAFGIAGADIVRVLTARGSILARAYVSRRQSPGTVFVPMHWTDQYASNGRIDTLIPSVTDPHSGQPALKHVPMRIERFAAAKYGFAVLRERPSVVDCAYWAIARCEGGFRLELAFAEKRDWTGVAASLFAASPGTETLAYRDAATGRHRFACFAGDRLIGSLFLGPEPVSVSRAWACEQLIAPHKDHRARLGVIAGRPRLGAIDRGAIICSCFGIGTNQIASAIADGCLSVTEVGKALGAGTNCGSCRAEISRLIERHGVRAAAAQVEDAAAS